MKLPLYPIFVKDPYFSFWADCVDGSLRIKTWWGEYKYLFGCINVDGKVVSFLGEETDERLIVQSITFDATQTVVVYKGYGIKLTVSFVSALPLFDLEVLSCPICEFRYDVETDLPARNIKVFLGLGQNVCYNDKGARHTVRGIVDRRDGYACACFGLDEQKILSNSADKTGADWGYYVLSAKDCAYINRKDVSYILHGNRLTTAPPTEPMQEKCI